MLDLDARAAAPEDEIRLVRVASGEPAVEGRVDLAVAIGVVARLADHEPLAVTGQLRTGHR